MPSVESTTLRATPKDELSISRLGLGGCPLGGHGWGSHDDAQARRAVAQAADAGINFFDTADCYGLGHSESLLSEALGQRRHDVTIASKFGVRVVKNPKPGQPRSVMDASPAYLRQALEASLKRLRIEQIPLYYLHWPDSSTPLEETLCELEAQKQAGKIRAIALSNHSPEAIKQAATLTPITAVQTEMSLIDSASAESLLASCDDAAVVTWGSLCQGLLTGKYRSADHFDASDRRSRYPNFQGERLQRNLRLVDALCEIATSLNKTPAQVALRWVLDTPGVGSVLFGAKTPAQVNDNLGALGWSLPAEAYDRLKSIAKDNQKAQQAAA